MLKQQNAIILYYLWIKPNEGASERTNESFDLTCWKCYDKSYMRTCNFFGLKIQERKNNNKKHHRQQRFSCVITNYGSLHTLHAISSWWSKWCIFYTQSYLPIHNIQTNEKENIQKQKQKKASDQLQNWLMLKFITLKRIFSPFYFWKYTSKWVDLFSSRERKKWSYLFKFVLSLKA